MHELDPSLMTPESLETTIAALCDALKPLAKLARGAGGGQAAVHIATGVSITNAKRLREQTYNALATQVNKSLIHTGCLPPIALQSESAPEAQIPIYATNWKTLAYQLAIDMADAIQGMKYALLLAAAGNGWERQLSALETQHWEARVQPKVAEISSSHLSIACAIRHLEHSRIRYLALRDNPHATWDTRRRSETALFRSAWKLVNLLNQVEQDLQSMYDEAKRFEPQHAPKWINKAEAARVTYIRTASNHRFFPVKISALQSTIPAKNPLSGQLLRQDNIEAIHENWHTANLAAAPRLNRILENIRKDAKAARRVRRTLCRALSAEDNFDSLAHLCI
ncbi:hypothetical protein JF732_10065 [Mycobacterium intracellulare]|uniref:Uncharacterized protein n=1 Tax=Mycobacterium intracellulare TaxID=1767 RepID=A0AAE4UD21_MYCIT|nr:hypothetical protein [Mycobacterium intracellulare]MCA2320438.1 hypothetical protein [Mycobacterium intracellulare]MCA2340888.1 hypothetical protein [Mycobacterium intracellulare]MDV6979051.1 hypothetical protein [Mycobacterium intracellulare]MDV6984357.1 hypothetical protein [Mycobacterium intracellulare]MDV7014067.1 hypothetical protein [Mycobacterium intracellulare]